MKDIKYVVLNPVHSTFKKCPIVIDSLKCNYIFKIDIKKHFSILTAQKFYKTINIFDRSEYPE